MASVYKLAISLSWWLGVVCVILGFLMKLVRPSGIRVFGTVTAHSLLFFAGTLFLMYFGHMGNGKPRRGEA